MNPAQRVDLATDAIWVDDRLAQPAKPLYWVLYKPVGYVTTRQDPDGRPTVYDLLPRSLPFVAPVGRLDLDSSGLLLFTNDTQFAAALTDPASHVPKVYEVLLDTAVSQREANALAAGVDVGGRRTSPARFQLVGPEPSVRLAVTLTEGRNRQVRRMFASIGRNVVELRRVQIGSLRLDGLDPGDARPLHEGELRALRDLVSRRR